MIRVKHEIVAGVLAFIVLIFCAVPSQAGTATPAAVVGTISGLVAATGSGKGLGGLKVYAQVADSFVVQALDAVSGEMKGEGRVAVSHGQLYVAETMSTGTFTLNPLPTGTYTVWVDSAGSGHVGQYFDGVGDRDAARPVLVVGGSDAGVQFALEVGGAISGTVRAAATGAVIAGVPVVAYPSAGGNNVARVLTAVDGTYLLSGLAHGRYRVVTESPDAYVNRSYGAVNAAEDALVEVLQRHTVTGIDFSLVAAASLAGTVRVNDGTPLAGSSVQAFGELSPGEFSRTPAGQGISGADGSFSIRSLSAGRYRLQGRAPGNFVEDSSPQLVQVAAGATVTGLGLIMEPGGSISGRLTSGGDGRALACGRIVAVDSRTGDEIRYSATAADGSYLLDRLPGGSFRVAAHLAGYEDGSYAGGVAGEVSLAPGERADAIDIALVARAPFRVGVISGRVSTAGDGVPLGDARVSVLDYASDMVHGFVCSDSTGGFRVADLADGAYRVCAKGKAGYADACMPVADGNPILVRRNEVTVEVPLAAVGSVSGRVVRQQDGTVIGRYRIANLAPGRYRLRMKTGGTGYRETFYGQGGGLQAEIVTVREGKETEGVDFSLLDE